MITDVDLDLLRMMVRLVISRGVALGLHPSSNASGKAHDEGAQEGGLKNRSSDAAVQVSTQIRLFLCMHVNNAENCHPFGLT